MIGVFSSIKVVSTRGHVRVDVTPNETTIKDPSGNSCMCLMGVLHIVWIVDEWFIILTNGWAHWRLNLLGPTNIYVFLTHVSLHGNNLHTASKDLTKRLYLSYMGREALRSRNLKLQIFSTRKALAFMESLSSYTPLYKHQTSLSLRYVKFLQTLTSLSSERFFYHWLNIRRVFGRHPIGVLCRFFILFVLQVPYHCMFGRSTHWRFLYIIS